MSGTNATVSRKKGSATLVRPKFEPGMLLQHDDLEQMSSYARDLNRLMFRSLFGCGVICGLVVKTEQNCGKDSIVVGAGLALDGCGDPIQVPTDQVLVIDEHCDPGLAPPLWVVLCRSTKCCAPRTAMCASDDEESMPVCTRERECFEIRVVRQQPKCTCHCEPPKKKEGDAHESECLCADPALPCYVDHYAGECGCNCDDCSSGACACDCVMLARLDRAKGEGSAWTADHSVRRFIRPILMRDPQVAREANAARQAYRSEAEAMKAKVMMAEMRNAEVKNVKGTKARKS